MTLPFLPKPVWNERRQKIFDANDVGERAKDLEILWPTLDFGYSGTVNN